MKKFVLIFALILVLTSGCKWFGEPDTAANQVVKTGISNLSNVTSLSFLLGANGELGSAQAVDGATKFVFDGNIIGKAEQKEPMKSNYQMQVTGKGGQSEDKMSEMDLELRVSDKIAYFNIKKLPDLGEQTQILSLFTNKWWKTEVPEGSLTGVSLPGGSTDNMTPEQKKVRELFNNTDFFTNLDYEGTEDVEGVSAYHYSGEIDKVNLKKFLLDSAQIQGNPMTSTDESDMDGYLSKLSFVADLWITKDTSFLTKLSGELSFEGKDGSTTDINLNIVFSEFNKAVSIEIPSGAEDLQQFLTGAMPGATGTTTLPEGSLIPEGN
jgi:hypothetical protein